MMQCQVLPAQRRGRSPEERVEDACGDEKCCCWESGQGQRFTSVEALLDVTDFDVRLRVESNDEIRWCGGDVVRVMQVSSACVRGVS